jgi:hypothetical protein
VRVTLRCLHMCMAQYFAYDRQAHPARGRHAGKAMPQVVKTDAVEASSRPKRSPRLLGIDQVESVTFANDHKRVAFDPWDIGQYGQCGRRQMKDFGAGF